MQKEIEDKMNLYTIVLEILDKGGTYIDQIISSNESLALIEWVSKEKKYRIIEEISDKDIIYISNNMGLSDYKPVLLDGLQSVWSTFISTEEKSLLFNIIQTQSSACVRSMSLS